MAKKTHTPAIPNLTRTPYRRVCSLSLKSLGLTQPNPFGLLCSVDTEVITWRGHIQMSGARGGGRWVKQQLKHLYSDTGKRCGEGGEVLGPRCIPHRNKPASHDCNYKPSSSLGVKEAFGMMGKGRS